MITDAEGDALVPAMRKYLGTGMTNNYYMDQH